MPVDLIDNTPALASALVDPVDTPVLADTSRSAETPIPDGTPILDTTLFSDGTTILPNTHILSNMPSTCVHADTAVLTNTLQLIGEELPCNWTRCNSEGSTIFSKVQRSSVKGSVVTHTLTIQCGGTWTLHVLGRKLDPRQYDILKEYVPLVDINKVRDLLSMVDRLHICSGHPDCHFVDMMKERIGTARGKGSTYLDDFCDVTIDGQTYNCTLRHNNCDIVVNGKARCHTCMAYRSTLRALYSRYIK